VTTLIPVFQVALDKGPGPYDPKMNEPLSYAILTALLHGLRADEVSKLKIEDYQTQIVAGYASKQLHIREAKADSTGWVLLFAEGIAEFEAYFAWYAEQAGALEPADPMFRSYSNRTKHWISG